MFKSPISINESDKGSTTFTYNSHLSRQTMNYGFTITPPATTGVYTKIKDYSDDGTVEIIKTPTTITIRTYITGDAYGAPLYVEKIKNLATGTIVDKKYYLHRDYLGSIIAISDENGLAIERRLFDAWGNLAKLQQNGVVIALPTDGTATKLLFLDRGYTSHEHLSEVGLIHMNGRLYDPVLRSFLMPDNFIQQPENTQNYNRYVYVLNNPLMYTDPSGEEFTLLAAVLIGAAVSAFTYTMTALLADVPFSVGGLLKATFIGAASAAVTFGIGTRAENLFTTFSSRAAFQAVAHGTFQGGMTAISGGKFWSGFAAGALSSIASSAFRFDGNGSAKGLGWASSVRESGAGMIAFGTVSGGAGATLTGGNFWQGAVTGLVIGGLNHYAHKMLVTDKKYYTYRDFKTDDNGNVISEKLVYFKNNTQEKLLYDQAVSEPLIDGQLSIYGHGNQKYIQFDVNAAPLANKLLATDYYLYNDSTMYKNFVDNGSNLIMNFKSCNTGTGNKNISQELSQYRSGLTIHAAAGFWRYNGTIQNNAGYNMFVNGANVGWDTKR